MVEAENTKVAKRQRIPRSQLPKTASRGWIHLVTAPLSLANSIVLLCFAQNALQAWSIVIYGLSALVLFSVSATYHIGNWSPKTKALLRRLDHANIFLLIAGTYTPISAMILPSAKASTVLAVVWIGAFFGILMHIFWINAPRWLYVLLYVALGWVAVAFMRDFWTYGSAAIVWLLIAGGLAYTVGAVMYAVRWPNPWPKHFGFHEFFHLGTVAGYVCHALAIWFALFLIR